MQQIGFLKRQNSRETKKEAKIQNAAIMIKIFFWNLLPNSPSVNFRHSLNVTILLGSRLGQFLGKDYCNPRFVSFFYSDSSMSGSIIRYNIQIGYRFKPGMLNSAITISTGATRHLRWYFREGGAFIKIPSINNQSDTIFFVHSKITFKHLLVGLFLDDSNIGYPAGVGPESIIMDFLVDSSEPKAVELTINGQQRFLRNKGCFQDLKIFDQTSKSPTSIYTHLKNYLGQKSSQKTVSVEKSTKINYFLLHYYTRMTAQTYCKWKNINMSQEMTPVLKNQILDYIGEQYENNSPEAIKEVEEEKDYIEAKIQKLREEIMEIESLCERRFGIYKWGAVAVTAAHILSFGYMIFFVDWLGWDIIEPLTYTVGVIYTLLGIRFYRKFKTDRSTQKIREVLLEQVINPVKLIQLKTLRNRLEIEVKQLDRIKTQEKILKNRINFSSSLSQSMQSIF